MGDGVHTKILLIIAGKGGYTIHVRMNRVHDVHLENVQMFIWMLNSVSDVHLVAHLRGGLTVDAGGEAEGGHAVPGVRPVNVVPKQYWHYYHHHLLKFLYIPHNLCIIHSMWFSRFARI